MSMAFVFILSGIFVSLLSLLLEVTFDSYVPKSSQKDIIKNHPKLRLCLNEWKEGYEKARYPELFSLIKDVENYLDYGQIQTNLMYASVAEKKYNKY